MKFLFNAMSSIFHFPAWMVKEGDVMVEKAPAVPIDPGQSVMLDEDHFNAVRDAGGKGNQVIDALLSGRYLVYGEQPGDPRLQMGKPAIENVPADLQDPVEGAELKVKEQAAAEVDLGNDEPVESPRRGRKA